MNDEAVQEPSNPDHEIKTVAVIGAGISGVVSAAHLLRAGMEVTVFERGDGIGGAWIYSELPDRDPPFPNTQIQSEPFGAAPRGELERATQSNGVASGPEDAARIFAPPGPVHTHMKSRSNEVLMRTTLRDWPDGIKAPIDPEDVVAYVRDIADTYQVHDKVRFRTRVDSIGREDRGWHVRTSTLFTSEAGVVTQERTARDFDAVVVAAGRNDIPRVPDVPGLAQWKDRFPSRIKHAKQYRSPEPYRDKTVLVVGAHVSALDITIHLVRGGVAKVYQSARPREIDFRGLVDRDGGANATVLEKVAMVAEFGALDEEVGVMALSDGSPIPVKVVLQDGRVLDGIHHVLFATGYLASFPFLGPDLEQPCTEPRDADETVIITSDARTVHNLHEDIFYIPDPSLAFIGISLYVSSFSMFDIQAKVVAAVWAGRAHLPSQAAMIEEQRRRKSLVQLLTGMTLNGIYILDDFVMRRLLDWVNSHAAEATAGCQNRNDALAGPDAKWWTAFRAKREESHAVLGNLQEQYLRIYGTSWEELQSQVLHV